MVKGICTFSPIRQAGLAADRDGKERDPAQPEFLGGGDGRLAEVGVAIAEEDYRAQVGLLFQQLGERGLQIGAGEGRIFRIGRGEGQGEQFVGATRLEGFPEVGGEGFFDPLGAGDHGRGVGQRERKLGVRRGHGLGIVPQDGDARFGVRVQHGAPFRLPQQHDGGGGGQKPQALEHAGAAAVWATPPGHHAQNAGQHQSGDADPEGERSG
jgi:hypothetical protein